jgi:hypothetical protein
MPVPLIYFRPVSKQSKVTRIFTFIYFSSRLHALPMNREPNGVVVVSSLDGNGVRFPAGARDFYLKNSRPAQGPTQPTLHWVPVYLQGREADQSPLVQRLRMSGAVPQIHLYKFMACTGITIFFTFTSAMRLLVLSYYDRRIILKWTLKE